MSKIEVIKPNNALLTESENIISVVAYCRVSTDKKDQKNSLEAQKEFFDYCFKEHPNWVNRKIYADEGISGTSLKKREAFNEMVRLALSPSHPIDLIITKDVSRFSRNVVDFYETIEKLHQNKVYIHFLAQDISTDSPDYRSILTEHIARAEQESLTTSKRVRFGQQLRMKQGVVFGVQNMYGYKITKDETGKQHFEIIEDEANTVKRIFEWYNEGIGTHRIARKLEQMGIQSKYKNGWSNTVILRILKQEKYVGDLCLGKTYTPDALKHNKKINKGESTIFRITDHHPEQAIIPRELWNSVQCKLEENSSTEEEKRKHNNRYWLSGKVVCGICNERYIRLSKKQKNGNTYVAWDCIQHQHRGTARTIMTDTGKEIEVGCNSRQVNEKVLRQAIIDIIYEIILPQKETIIEQVKSYIISTRKSNAVEKEMPDKTSIEKELAEQTEMKKKALNFLLKGVLQEDDYKSAVKDIDQKIFSLNVELQKIESYTSSENQNDEEIKKYIDAINTILDSITDEKKVEQYSEYQEELLHRVTKKIVVHPDKILEIYLNAIPYPIYLQYNATGRAENYSVKFTIINRLPE